MMVTDCAKYHQLFRNIKEGMGITASYMYSVSLYVTSVHTIVSKEVLLE